MEHGEYSKFMIRQLIEAYYDENYEPAKPAVNPLALTPEEIMAGISGNNAAASLQQ